MPGTDVSANLPQYDGLAGGTAYAGGVAFYATEGRRFSYLVWHRFVRACTCCHFIAVLFGLTMLIHPDESIDRLTSRLRIIQKRRGHRAASDDTLLAWAAARAHPEAKRVLDLGSGKGTVAMLLLQRLPRCRVIGLEGLAENNDLAVRNATLNGLADRWEPRLGDLRDPTILRGEPPFNLVTGAPPFMPAGSGVMPADPARAAGRFELRGGIREFAAAAAGALAPDGKVVLLMDGLDRSETRATQALADSGLFACKIIVVRPSPDRNPIYRIFEASRQNGSRTEISLCMRIDEAGGFSPEYEAVRHEMDCSPVESPQSQG